MIKHYYVNFPDGSRYYLLTTKPVELEATVIYDREHYDHQLFIFNFILKDLSPYDEPYVVAEMTAYEIWLEPYKEKD